MDKKIRILYISELVEMGGGEKWLFSIIERLDKKRFLPILLCPKRGPLVFELEKRGVKVVIKPFGLAVKFFGFIPVISPLGIIRFFRVIVSEKIDLIHANCFSAFVFSALPAKILGVPLVWNVHGWTSGGGIQGALINFFAARVITVSSAVKKFIAQSGMISENKIDIISLGVDLERFKGLEEREEMRKKLGIPKGTPLIAIVGRLQAIKGHYYFLKAAELLKKEFPDAKFLIVGARLFGHKKDEGYPEQVERWIKETSFESDIISTGFRGDTLDIIASVDVLVMSSIRESFGLVLAEAMAAGTAVVSTSCAGPEDIVEDKVSGLLVPVKDYKALADAVIFLLNNPDKKEAMIEAAKNRVRQYFSLDKQTEKFETVYSSLIKI